MDKMERVEDSAGRALPLRIWSRRGSRTQTPSIRVKCGCCDEAVVIHFDKKRTDDNLEINGVNGTVDQWKKILLPLLGLDA